MIRKLILSICFITLFVCLAAKEQTNEIISSGTISKFDTIVGKAKFNNWRDIPIGELTAKVGLEFLGTPYKDRTLEGEPEMCKINFEGMDCVTFFENSLDLARIIRKDKLEFGNLIDETIDTIQEPKPKSGLFKKFLTEEKFDEMFEELQFILLENNVAYDAVEKIKDSLKEKLIGQDEVRHSGKTKFKSSQL